MADKKAGGTYHLKFTTWRFDRMGLETVKKLKRVITQQCSQISRNQKYFRLLIPTQMMKAPKSKILSITAIIVAFLAMACSLVNARYYAKLVMPPPRSSHYYHHQSFDPFSLVSEMMSAPMYFSSTTKEQQQEVEANTPSERSGPRYSVSEENGVVLLEMEIPGVYAKDIEIDLEDEKLLRIKGRRTYKPSRDGSTDQTEFDVTFRLKENVDTSQLKANLVAGILRVQVPNKAKEMKRIPIGFDGGDGNVAIAVPNDRNGEHQVNVSSSLFDASTEETVNGITIIDETDA